MTNINNSSYETYFKYGLESLSKHFSVKTYKLAKQENYRGFERGKDLRIQIRWKSECIWEWIIEKTFWIQSNTNKEDRIYMRKHADVKIDACRNALVKPKKKSKKKNVTKKNVTKKIEVAHTQICFDKMKKNDTN